MRPFFTLVRSTLKSQIQAPETSKSAVSLRHLALEQMAQKSVDLVICFVLIGSFQSW